MPKQQLREATDADVQNFIKGWGAAPSAPGAPAASASEEPRPGHVPTDDELDWQQRAGKGVAKEGASLITGTGRLINKGIGLVSPSTRDELGELAERIPGVKRMEAFAAEPSSSFAESAGGLGLDLATGFAAPELGIGSRIAQVANKIAPTARYVRGMGLVPTGFGRAAGAASTAGEAAGKGAIGGAVANPDDPETGAIAGAAGGAALPAASAFLRSPIGKTVGGFAARGGVGAGFAGLAHLLGVPHQALTAIGLAPFVHHWHGLGSGIHRFGRYAFDRAGRVIGYIDPVTGGIVAGRVSED